MLIRTPVDVRQAALLATSSYRIQENALPNVQVTLNFLEIQIPVSVRKCAPQDTGIVLLVFVLEAARPIVFFSIMERVLSTVPLDTTQILQAAVLVNVLPILTEKIRQLLVKQRVSLGMLMVPCVRQFVLTESTGKITYALAVAQVVEKHPTFLTYV